MADFTTEEDRLALEAIMSDFQTGGVTMSAEIDPYWFFEETGDEQDRMDRLMLFMLRYFPDSFTTWEPINHLFFRFLEYTNKGLAKLPGQHGKDLDCATPVLTTSGWKTIGDVQVGDYVYAGDGQPTRVVAVSQVFTDHICYELKFSDGATIVAGEDHLWTVQDEADHGAWKTISTKRIAESFWHQKRGTRNRFRYRIRADAVPDTPFVELPIDPYIFGYWLGDGSKGSPCLTVSNDDLEYVLDAINDAGYSVTSCRQYGPSTAWRVCFNINQPMRDGFMSRAKRLGVLYDKHIPDCYLSASIDQRLALLAGLMDSDGSITHSRTSPQCEISLASDRLCHDVLCLLRSLGVRTRIGKRNRINWTPTFNPFRMPRKACRFRKPVQDKHTISIIGIKQVESRPTRCIQIAHPSGVFLVGRLFTPTHNSTMLHRWIIWTLPQCPSISFIYTEKNEPTACRRSRATRMRLEENKLLIHDYGVFKPPASSTKPWSDSQWTINQRTKSIDTPTMAVFGAGGASLLGNRCNVLIVDDPVTPENSRSEKERDYLWDWHSEAASTCPAPLPVENERYLVKEFLVGTVFRRDDLYHRAEATGEYEVLHLPAVIDEIAGTTLSPRFCFIHPDELERKARIDPYYESLYEQVKARKVKNLYQWMLAHSRTAYNRRFQNIAVNEEEQWCKEVYIRGGGEGEPYAPAGGWPGCLDRDRSMGETREGWIYVTGCDPQGGRKHHKNARFAAVTLAADPRDPAVRYIVDIDVGQYPLESDNPHITTQISLLLKHARKYGGKVIIESNAQQSGWQDVLRKAARAAGIVVSVEGHFTDAKKNDPEIGIQAMAPLFENGYIRFPYRSARDQRICDQLIDELIYWKNHPTNDIVMALWFANNRLERLLKTAKVTSFNQGINRPYINRLVTTHFPQHWTPEQIAAWKEEQAAAERERREREDMAVCI